MISKVLRSATSLKKIERLLALRIFLNHYQMISCIQDLRGWFVGECLRTPRYPSALLKLPSCPALSTSSSSPVSSLGIWDCRDKPTAHGPRPKTHDPILRCSKDLRRVWCFRNKCAQDFHPRVVRSQKHLKAPKRKRMTLSAQFHARGVARTQCSAASPAE